MAGASGSRASWSNWSGSVVCRPRWRVCAADEAAVAAAVERARRDDISLRTVGSGHSHSPLVATDGGLLELAPRVALEVDAERGEAWIGAGAALHDLEAPLRERGFALRNLGDIDVQTLAGALATGTHGTGRELGNLSSSVLGVRGVAADGSRFEWNEEDDPERLCAARVSLGVLGVVCHVRMQLAKAHCLHERIERLSAEACMEQLDERSRATRHFEIFWYPGRDRVDAKSLHPVDAPPDPLTDRPYERIDWSGRILPSVRSERFVEMEYAIAAEDALEVFAALRARIRSRHPTLQWPVELRFVAADDAWLSPANGRPTATLSLHQAVELPFRALFDDLERLLLEAEGRPHWGKWHGLGARELAARFPGWERFRRLRAQLDPEDRFLAAPQRALLLD
jgi:FAD/FMN-containing dehydrogenase